MDAIVAWQYGIADLIKWLFEFAFQGGFWHWVGTFLIILAIGEVFRPFSGMIKINKATQSNNK